MDKKDSISTKRQQDVDWEKEYQRANLRVWEKKAHTYSRLAARLVKQGTVLDLGCGEGYDCFYFAKNKYRVTGVDISPSVIKNILAVAKAKKITIRGIVKDLKQVKVIEPVDIAVSYGALQFLGKKFTPFLKTLKQKTRPKGVHAFYIFGDHGDFYKLAKERFYFPSAKELKALYRDWKIVKFEQKKTKLFIKGDKGEALYNSMLKIWCRTHKIRSRHPERSLTESKDLERSCRKAQDPFG